jgi:A/G-specific adenine glycosylase
MDIKRLESWYQFNHRKLSFRMTKNPYDIWVSEVMLQQTQVETVLPYFERFIKKYPTVSDLAKADEETLHKDVEGLGYYRRFKNMLSAAKIILESQQGKFPDTYEGLLALPGIGKYTSGAIMSIAYNKPYSALDGNVIRVLSRLLANDSDMREEKHRKVLDRFNQTQIEKSQPEIYTQAMMELGATLCRPKNPKCDSCPLQTECLAFKSQSVHLYPNLSPLNQKQIESYVTLMIHHDHKVMLRKRTESLLNGIYEYPQYESESIQYVLSLLDSQGVHLSFLSEGKTYQHIFTHKIWNMHVVHVHLIGKPHPDWIAVDKEHLKQLPMAIAHRKIKVESMHASSNPS